MTKKNETQPPVPAETAEALHEELQQATAPTTPSSHGLEGTMAATLAQPDPLTAFNPTVGRVVHFGVGEDGPLAAIITAVHEEGYVGLCIFRTTGTLSRTHVPFSAEPTLGCWSIPPRS